MGGMILDYYKSPYLPDVKLSLKDKERIKKQKEPSKHNKARELRFKARRKNK